jgi:hypothetical protein
VPQPVLPSGPNALALLHGERGAALDVAGDVAARTVVIGGALLLAKVPLRRAALHGLIGALAIEVMVMLWVAQTPKAGA